MTKRLCNEYANGVKRAAGWIFAHMFNFYFGEATIILVGEGPDGSDVEFFITPLWLEKNHTNAFGFTNDLSSEFDTHIKKCTSAECIEANRRIEAIVPFLSKGKLPGGDAIILISACEGKRRSDKLYLSRKNGFGSVIDEIYPFIKWFTEERDFWIWPD